MVSKHLEDYEVLGILGADTLSSFYKVRNKCTQKLYFWKAFNVANLNEAELRKLLQRVKDRMETDQPHLLKFHDWITYKDKVLYLVMEYCAQGNLYTFISSCIESQEQITEKYLKELVYKIILLAKTCKIGTPLSISNIFLTESNSILFMNFEEHKSANIVKDVCSIMLQLAAAITSGLDKLKTGNKVLQCYSKDLQNILNDCIKGNNEDWTLDTLLCHPVFMTWESVNGMDMKTFKHKICSEDATSGKENTDNHKLEAKLLNLQKKETYLRTIADNLKQKEHELNKREKKISLMERLCKEKTRRAELYLKNAQTIKIKKNTAETPTYENLDTSFSADCGESTIMPTSKKMYHPSPKKTIIRTSDRTIKFKGHSPLKDIHYNVTRRSRRTLPSAYDNKEKKQTQEGQKQTINKRLSAIFPWTKYNHDKENVQIARPISWTEQNKKQAFELLKIMKEEQKLASKTEIKHTSL